MKSIKYLHAELIKLKYLPIFWLVALVVFSVVAIVLLAHILDSSNITQLGRNPWNKLFFAGHSILSVFLIIPFIFLFISAAVYIEHQSNAWKFQYTSPTSRTSIFFAKLTSYISIIILVFFLVMLSLICCGYILSSIYPEMEFNYFPIYIFDQIGIASHGFLSVLGIIGIHYFLSLRFKGFLIPASIGVIGFIAGLIMGTLNRSFVLYFPYSYPVIYKDHSMFKIDRINIIDFGLINNVELFSILTFIVFVLLALFLERKKQIL